MKRVRLSKGRYRVKCKLSDPPHLKCRKGCKVMFWDNYYRRKHERDFHKGDL